MIIMKEFHVFFMSFLLFKKTSFKNINKLLIIVMVKRKKGIS